MTSCSSGCHHDHASLSKPRPQLWLTLLLVAGFSLTELVGGWFAHSLSLMADAGHLATDALSVGTVMLVLWLHRSSQHHSSGSLLLENRIALLSGVVLLGLSLAIGLGALAKLTGYLPAEPIASLPTLVLAGLGLLVCLLNLVLLHPHSHDSLGLRSVFLHILMDALTSLGVLVAAVLVWTLDWQWADSVMGLMIGALMLPTACSLVWQSWRTLKPYAMVES
ncbi:cation diffusion facilitator family transporter [Leptolyngbya sp. FACHB-261]|uniref:cation diffusion facilitator family transporter n=1 Tax=Leptolyngbya sp. FACHB-261 TaxID=2692806 RepID=UPI0016837079|nr:cation diffusion facilitator family transporter [Leptolyngbya sp. FACHB-261]MBD2100202.1 cation transporter [Leptolyngbya sp. FACHB-261]